MGKTTRPSGGRRGEGPPVNKAGLRSLSEAATHHARCLIRGISRGEAERCEGEGGGL